MLLDHFLKWPPITSGDGRHVDTREMASVVVTHDHRIYGLENKVQACMNMAREMQEFLDFCIEHHPLVYAEYSKLKSVTHYISTGSK